MSIVVKDIQQIILKCAQRLVQSRNAKVVESFLYRTMKINEDWSDLSQHLQPLNSSILYRADRGWWKKQSHGIRKQILINTKHRNTEVNFLFVLLCELNDPYIYLSSISLLPSADTLPPDDFHQQQTRAWTLVKRGLQQQMPLRA